MEYTKIMVSTYYNSTLSEIQTFLKSLELGFI